MPDYYLGSDVLRRLSMSPFDGKLSADPSNAHVYEGSHTFTVNFNDQNSSTVSQTVTLTVVNREPQFIAPAGEPATFWNDDPANGIIPHATATEDHAFSFDVRTDDEMVGKNVSGSFITHYTLLPWENSDPDPVLANEYSTAPSWLTFNTATGVMSGNPTNDNVGTYYFRIKVEDGNSGEVIKHFQLTVDNVNPLFLTPSDTSGSPSGDPA